MVDKNIARESLASSIFRRATISAVAGDILTLIGDDLPAELEKSLKDVSRHAGFIITESSFHTAAPLAATVHSTFTHFFPHILIPVAASKVSDDYLDAWDSAIVSAGCALNVESPVYSPSDFALTLPRQDWKRSIFASKKQFKKAALFLARVHERLVRTRWSLRLQEAAVEAKSRFSYLLDPSKLDDTTLSVVAYMVARANRKTVFTAESQSRVFDTIHEDMVKLIPANANWVELAKVYPVGYVLHKLDETELDAVRSRARNSMEVYARLLGELHGSGSYAPLIASHSTGVDTTAWNLFSGAYNNARSAWVNATVVAGKQDEFSVLFPGKMCRYIAGDVMRMHEVNGTDVDSANLLDMYLYNILPRPWGVLDGNVIMTIDSVIDAAYSTENGIPAEKVREMLNTNGWLTPRSDVRTEEPSLDKILVYGVEVASQELADLLRKLGAFSGKASPVSAEAEEELESFLVTNPHVVEYSSTGTRVISV